MLKSENLSSEIAISLLFVLMWHAIIFIFCKTLSNDFFNYDKYIYKQKYWEDNGFFYSKRLKIKAWKDLLPQYISRSGFSKKSLDSLSIEYLDMFILETCRGEWAHRGCMLISLLLLSLNRSVVGLVLGALVVLVNLPYICIQRYNRIRFLKVRERILQQSKQKNEHLIGVVKRLDIANLH